MGAGFEAREDPNRYRTAVQSPRGRASPVPLHFPFLTRAGGKEAPLSDTRHTCAVTWRRAPAEAFTDGRYSRAHFWRFDGGLVVPAAASPHVVAPACTDERAVDPEEAFVASLASCHMLWFLSLAAKRGIVVDEYRDEAEGLLARDGEGQLALTRVALRPRLAFPDGHEPSRAELEVLHHEAHEACFLARSVRSDVRVELGELALGSARTRAHVHEETFPAAPEALFALLHTPSAIRGWWGAARAVVVPEAGGAWSAAWGADEDAPDYTTCATIRAFEPPRRMVLADYRYRAKSGPLPFQADFVTEFRVEPRSGGALLRVTQSGFPCGPEGESFLAGCERGWRDTFAGIRRHLAQCGAR